MPDQIYLEINAFLRVYSRLGNSNMLIRYGFDIALSLVQPTTTILMMMDVHSEVRCGVAEELDLELAPIVPAERFVDDNGNVVRRLTAPPGIASLTSSRRVSHRWARG